jgi:hypothetical protein
LLAVAKIRPPQTARFTEAGLAIISITALLNNWWDVFALSLVTNCGASGFGEAVVVISNSVASTAMKQIK